MSPAARSTSAGRLQPRALGRSRAPGGSINITSAMLTNTGATLVINGTTGSINLGPAGLIIGGTISTAGGAILIATGGTIDGVTVNGTVDVTTGTLSVRNNLVLNGAMNVGVATLAFDSAAGATNQNLSTATSAVVTIGSSTIVRQSGVSHTVTVGTGVTITATGGATIGNTLPGTWVNHGVWSATPGASLQLVSLNTYTNEAGGVWATGGGTFGISGTLTGALWNNLGTISVGNGTFNMGGNFTAANIGAVTRTGGTIVLNGLLTGGWAMPSGFGDVFINGGILRNGVFSTPADGTASLIANGTTSSLEGMTLNSPIEMGLATTDVTVRNGLSLNTTLQLGHPTTASFIGHLLFEGSQTLRTDGNGVIVAGVAGTVNGNAIRTTVAGTTLTIGQGIELRGMRLAVGRDGDTVINRGRITATAPAEKCLSTLGRADRIKGSSPRRAALVHVHGGIGGSWTNFGQITVAGSTLQLGNNGGVWSNTGTISVTNTTVELRGTFTQAGMGGSRATRRRSCHSIPADSSLAT